MTAQISLRSSDYSISISFDHNDDYTVTKTVFMHDDGRKKIERGLSWEEASKQMGHYLGSLKYQVMFGDDHIKPAANRDKPTVREAMMETALSEKMKEIAPVVRKALTGKFQSRTALWNKVVGQYETPCLSETVVMVLFEMERQGVVERSKAKSSCGRNIKFRIKGVSPKAKFVEETVA